jgi:hypothetical protein
MPPLRAAWPSPRIAAPPPRIAMRSPSGTGGKRRRARPKTLRSSGNPWGPCGNSRGRPGNSRGSHGTWRARSLRSVALRGGGPPSPLRSPRACGGSRGADRPPCSLRMRTGSALPTGPDLLKRKPDGGPALSRRVSRVVSLRRELRHKGSLMPRSQRPPRPALDSGSPSCQNLAPSEPPGSLCPGSSVGRARD